MKLFKKIVILLPLIFSTLGCDRYQILIKRGNAEVFIIIGQSNASGYTEYSYLKTKDKKSYNKYRKQNKRVLISYAADVNSNDYFEPVKFGFGTNKDCFGPEIGISEVIQKKNKPTYIIKATIGGTGLNKDWLENGNRGSCYNYSLKIINNKLNYLKANDVNPQIKGIFWMQGESDSFNEEDYSSYKTNTISLINYLSTDLSNYIYNYFNFVDATIKQRDDVWHYANIVNKAKIEVANENEHRYCVLTNNENESGLMLSTKNMTGEGNDPAHYDSISMLKLGLSAGEFLIK